MASRNLNQARAAYDLGDIELSRNAHQKSSYSHPVGERHNKSGAYIKSSVYGGLDGILTAFAIVTGVVGGNLHPIVVLILGLSSVVGDGLAMAIGDYVSTKSEKEYQLAERKREEWEVENNPEGEKLEMEEIYINKGLTVEDTKVVIDALSKNKKVWVDIMMLEELGLIESNESPAKNALITFFSFAIFGLVPLLPFIVGAIIGSYNGAFYASIGVTAVVLFFLGAIKTRVTGKNWIFSGIETLLMGCVAAGVAFLIGWLLHPLAE